MKTGIELIAEERQRQIEIEGWTPEHDDQYTDGQLAEAASCYAAFANSISVGPDEIAIFRGSVSYDFFAGITRDHRWPWDDMWWKPSPNDRIRELQKAGALIAAEIDRLNRIQ